MSKHVCDLCGYVYDPDKGSPESGVAAGTAFEDIPASWTCPMCKEGKKDSFYKV